MLKNEESPPPYNDGMYNSNHPTFDGIHNNTYHHNDSNSYFPSNNPMYGNTTSAADPNGIYAVVGHEEAAGQGKNKPFFGFIYLEDGICRSPIRPSERGRAYFLLFLCFFVFPGLFLAYIVHHFIVTPNLKIAWFRQVADVAVAAQMSFFSFIGQAVGVSIVSQVSGFSYVSMASIFSFYSMVSAVSCGSLFSFFSLHPKNGICLWRVRNPYYWN